MTPKGLEPKNGDCGRDRIRSRSPLGSGEYHVDLPAAALRTHQPLAPIEHGRFGAVPSDHLGRVGLDPVPAFLAPDDMGL
jgi:hypothetical protein